MNDEEIILAKLEELALAFPRQEIQPEALALYARRLATMPTTAVLAAIDRLIDSARFFPTIGEIKEAAAAGPLGRDLADEAWAEVLREIKRVGFNRPPLFHNGRFEPAAVPEFSSPLIAEAASTIGWDVLCTSDKPEVVRAQFLKAFAALRDREIYAKQTGAAPVTATDIALPAAGEPTLLALNGKGHGRA